VLQRPMVTRPAGARRPALASLEGEGLPSALAPNRPGQASRFGAAPGGV